MFVLNGDKLVFFVTRQRQRNTIYVRKHRAKYANLSHEEKQQKVEEFKDSLLSQKNNNNMMQQ